MDVFEAAKNCCILPDALEIQEDPRINYLRRIIYGIIMPMICFLGIIGNILNLIVLTRRNMQGAAYIYMRGEWPNSILISIVFLLLYQGSSLPVFQRKMQHSVYC